MAATQTYSNHTKWDPKFHFFASPLFFINLGYRLYMIDALDGAPDAIWDAIFAVALLVALFSVRLYSLKVQDRLIRLEERLRLQAVLPEAMRPRIHELTVPQLVGLRFASDAELPALVEKVLATGMGTKEIKKSIQTWRPDDFRV
jgi:hypothetical protein